MEQKPSPVLDAAAKQAIPLATGFVIGEITKRTVTPRPGAKGGTVLQIGSAMGAAAASGASVGGTVAAGAAVVTTKVAAVVAATTAAAPVVLGVAAAVWGLTKLVKWLES
jgi:hypothetical protein